MNGKMNAIGIEKQKKYVRSEWYMKIVRKKDI